MTLPARQLVDSLLAAGVILEPRGALLHVEGPGDVLTVARLAELRAAKAEVLRLLAPPAEVVDMAVARARLLAAGCLRRRGDGRVTTPRGPGRLLQLFSDRATVVLDAEPERAQFLDPSDLSPEVGA